MLPIYIVIALPTIATVGKQRTDTKKDAKRIKSDNFTRGNREKSNIAIPILAHPKREIIMQAK